MIQRVCKDDWETDQRNWRNIWNRFAKSKDGLSTDLVGYTPALCRLNWVNLDVKQMHPNNTSAMYDDVLGFPNRHHASCDLSNFTGGR